MERMTVPDDISPGDTWENSEASNPLSILRRKDNGTQKNIPKKQDSNFLKVRINVRTGISTQTEFLRATLHCSVLKGG